MIGPNFILVIRVLAYLRALSNHRSHRLLSGK